MAIRQLDIPDPHLYFQAPGGQVFRLVGIDEDLFHYDGTGKGPDVAKVKAAFLILVGDHDLLAVIPDSSHFILLSEPEKVIPTIRGFLDEPERRIPLATAKTGYHPRETQ